jgi:hypothetical protein
MHLSFLLKLFNKLVRLLFANEYLDSSEAGDKHPEELDSSSADLKDRHCKQIKDTSSVRHYSPVEYNTNN